MYPVRTSGYSRAETKNPLRTRRGLLSLVVVGTTFTGSGGTAQESKRVELPPPDAVAPVRLTRVTSVRELTDGSLLVTDPAEKRLVQIRWDSEKESVIGRTGNGPGEFRAVGWLYPLAGDSTLFTDSYSGRWNLMDGASIVGTLSEVRPLNRLMGGHLLGADRQGHVLGERGYQFSPGARELTESADSLLVLLGDWASQRVDTIARVQGLGNSGVTILPAERNWPPTIIGSNPLASRDQARLFDDGWIALVRVDPYRVDWREPDGHWTRGFPLPLDTVKLDKQQKCAAMERFLKRAYNRCDPSVLPGWPEALPPFLASGRRPVLFAAPDGNVVIHRATSGSSGGNEYDVVDRSGRLVVRFGLKANWTLIGFGDSSAYVVNTDHLGLQSLQRHPWPDFGAARPGGPAPAAMR